MRNSQEWVLKAIGRCLDPTVCMFLEAGTKMHDTVLYNIWKVFDIEPDLGAATTVVKPYGPSGNPITSFQKVEYHLQRQLTSRLESFLGFRFTMHLSDISAYRFAALRSSEGEVLPSYFETKDGRHESWLSSLNDTSTLDRAVSNSFRGDNRPHFDREWTTVTVLANAFIDVPDDAYEFVLQRRRWIQGDLFDTFDAWRHLRVGAGKKLGILRRFNLGIGISSQILFMILQLFATVRSSLVL